MNTLNRRQFLAGAGATGAGLAAATLPSAAACVDRPQQGQPHHQERPRLRRERPQNTIAEAIAIGGDGTIVGVGSYQRLKRFANSKTEVIDGRGGTVIAGLQDGHSHPMYAGLAAMNPSLEDAELSAADVQALVATFLTDPDLRQ